MSTFINMDKPRLINVGMNLTAEITLSVYTLLPLRLPRVATKYVDNKFIIIIITSSLWCVNIQIWTYLYISLRIYFH